MLGALEESRLVTLVGPGGAGKTRLGLEVAWAVAGRKRHCAWFVDLPPLADGEQLSGTVGAVFALRERHGPPPLEPPC